MQLGKIGGRLRRQAICLLAVVLDPIGEEAPALNKLLEQLPKVCNVWHTGKHSSADISSSHCLWHCQMRLQQLPSRANLHPCAACRKSLSC